MNSMEKIRLLPSEEQKYMRKLFAECTNEVRENLSVKEVKKEYNFITAGERCNSIFVLLRGRAKGIDTQVQGKVYAFKEFGPGSVLGEFECLSGIPEYSITIRTITDSIFWVLPSPVYFRWMKRDGNALFLRTQRLLLELTYQTIESRKHLLINCDDRLILYFLEQCEGHREKGDVIIRKSREEMANTTGFHVKTINRNIKKLQTKGYLSIEAGKINISREQYKAMKTYTENCLF